MFANAETKWAVLAAVDALLSAIANGQLNEAMACFADGADVQFMGSEKGETFTGAAAIRAQLAMFFAEPYRIVFDFPERRVSAAGNVAWFTGEGSYRLTTGPEEFPYRLIAILERRRERWLWQVFDGSEPR